MSRADFEAWARAETPGLLRRAVLLCGDRAQAEDLVQETLIKLYVNWRKVDHDQSPLGYAHTTLFHQFCSSRRKLSSTERPMADLPERAGGEGPTSDLRLDLAQALGTLAPRDRCVVVARYLDDRSVAEVATMLGRTQDWVRTTCHRAIQRLRRSPDLFAGFTPAPATDPVRRSR